jgi:rhodanese-related sulfurtransferase
MRQARSKVPRSMIMTLGGVAMVVLVALGAWAWINRYAAEASPETIVDAAMAHERARAGEIVLVDVRRPSEWKSSGVPASGHAITMHQDGAQFLAKLRQAAAGNLARPIALICATGGRTTWLLPHLQKAGFTNVLNVAEGMFGSTHGKGWLKHGLPVRRWLGPQSASPELAK